MHAMLKELDTLNSGFDVVFKPLPNKEIFDTLVEVTTKNGDRMLKILVDLATKGIFEFTQENVSQFIKPTVILSMCLASSKASKSDYKALSDNAFDNMKQTYKMLSFAIDSLVSTGYDVNEKHEPDPAKFINTVLNIVEAMTHPDMDCTSARYFSIINSGYYNLIVMSKTFEKADFSRQLRVIFAYVIGFTSKYQGEEYSFMRDKNLSEKDISSVVIHGAMQGFLESIMALIDVEEYAKNFSKKELEGFELIRNSESFKYLSKAGNK